MAVYLIDFENVTSAGISGIQRLTKDDKVYIFYTVNASNMSFAAHLNLLSSPAEVIYYNVSSGGKNALDFQLASFLGYLISKGEDKNFCIISNDKGYDYVKSFWERSGLAAGITVNSSPSINRSLLPMERPFASKIQQTVQEAKTAEKIEEKHEAETVSEITSAASEISETVPEKADIPAETQAAAPAEAPDPEEVMEKKPAKRRGRPKSKKAETKSAASAENASKSGKAANPAKAANNTVKKDKSFVSDSVSQSVKNAAAKAGVSSEKEISGILELLRSADGKQQFYRGLLKIFGMERGVEVYKAVRPEYTNLSKMVR